MEQFASCRLMFSLHRGARSNSVIIHYQAELIP